MLIIYFYILSGNFASFFRGFGTCLCERVPLLLLLHPVAATYVSSVFCRPNVSKLHRDEKGRCDPYAGSRSLATGPR